MPATRVLLWIAAASLVAGLLLIFIWDGEAGWFAYAPESESAGFGTSLVISGGRFVSDQQIWGWGLVGASAVNFSGVVGYTYGGRTASGQEPASS